MFIPSYMDTINIRRDAKIECAYWINLPRSFNRCDKMYELFIYLSRRNNYIGFPKKRKRICAVDGKYEDIYKYFTYGETPSPFILPAGRTNEKTKLEFACLLSHLRAIHEFYKEGSPGKIAVIMEDDITADFLCYCKKTLLQIAEEAPKNWEILQLCYTTGFPLAEQDYEMVDINNRNGRYGTCAYMIKYEAAQKIISQIYDEETGKYNLDNGVCWSNSAAASYGGVYYVADHYIYSILKTYTYKYPVFIYSQTEPSTIHEEHNDFHIKSRNNIEKMLINESSATAVADSYIYIFIAVGFMFSMFLLYCIL